jgi:hypothetical protein
VEIDEPIVARVEGVKELAQQCLVGAHVEPVVRRGERGEREIQVSRTAQSSL